MEEEVVNNMDINCLICNRKILMNADGRSQCGCCSSVIFLNEKLEPYIFKNNVPFNLINLLTGIMLLIGVIGSFIFLRNIDASLTFIGLAYLLAPFLGMFQHGVFYKSYMFQDSMDLHRALITKPLWT